ncbi:hypothetical protein SAMN04488115_104118 [Bosea lathyri]|uniref:Uncharacterized protein n=1 Tax=Bosea lathyri TaxID=1036778 RepID=A0A1H5YV52_9HYPH|nr:hypothetical protein SAMN04488115_104118 [Bosea lathyri]
MRGKSKLACRGWCASIFNTKPNSATPSNTEVFFGVAKPMESSYLPAIGFETQRVAEPGTRP